jgi:prepilin-type N-terminal cleavage/methylation domain-containing protein
MMIGKQTRNNKLLITLITHPLTKIFTSRSKSKQEGFTIIESLVAIVIVSILLAAIGPVIVLSVANRVQARRIETASQAARSYIDGVRIKRIESPLAPSVVSPNKKDISTYDPPVSSSSFNCDTNSYCTNTGTTSTTSTNLYCIDFDGDSKCKNTSNKDTIIQAFRNTDSSSTGYALGIRVYRADAFSGATLKASNQKIASSNENHKQQNTFTGGLGSKQTPLLEMTTEISDIVPKYGELCNRIGCPNN